MDGDGFGGRFESSYSYGSGGLERFLFGGKVGNYGEEQPVGYYWIQTCDALGRPYQELGAGRGMLPSFLLSPGEFPLLSSFLLCFPTLLQFSSPSLDTIVKEREAKTKGISLFFKDPVQQR